MSQLSATICQKCDVGSFDEKVLIAMTSNVNFDTRQILQLFIIVLWEVSPSHSTEKF